MLSGMYPATLEGLTSCYILAIPFFQNTLISTLFFASVIFYATIIFDKYIDRRVQFNLK
ncbi:MAG: DUF6580 family putative transport protein [Alphaproteobacteria bacterium]